jgi:copper oxidase (laccase) domain-containing protein
LDEGVKASDISVVDLCSHCEEDLLSYRRSHSTEDRMLSFIGITNPDYV